MSDGRVQVSVTLAPYSHAYEIRSGAVELAGIAASFVQPAGAHADVHEMSFAAYLRARSAGDQSFTAVPVFLSRAFVHSWIHVGAERSGLPDAEESVAVYAQGILRELSDDSAVVIAPPRAAAQAGALRPFFERASEVEREAYVRTQVFPILSVLVVRSALLEQHRWLGSNIYRAFEVSRRRCMARLEDIRGSRVPIPSVAGHVGRLRDLLGAEIWPYGIEPNRPTLEAFLRYGVEQRLIPAGLYPDVAELFYPVEPFVDSTDGV